MGLLRLILACAVVFSHAGNDNVFTGSEAAVQTFYMISGFYVALILDRTAAYKSVFTFYSNRYLRLFPVYLTMAAVTLLVKIIATPAFLPDFRHLPLSAQALLAFTNATMFLQDWVMFLGVHSGHLHFVSNFNNSNPPLYKFLLVPQAWSIGMEIAFYVVAPFLLRWKTRSLLVLVSASLLARGVAYHYGLSNDPWSYRFFPFEIAQFCFGALSYRLYCSVLRKPWFESAHFQFSALALVVGFTLVFSQLSLPFRKPLYYALVCLLMPALFDLSKDWRTDRFISELSYPTYICHVLVVWVYKSAAEGLPALRLSVSAAGVVVCLVSVGVAALLYLVVQRPVEAFRRARAGKSSSAAQRKDTASSSPTPQTAPGLHGELSLEQRIPANP